MRRVARSLALVTVAATTIGLPQAASASGRTTATVYQAFTSSGQPTFHPSSRSGNCFTGSLTINRIDAWRCVVGNLIYDPCFSSPKAHGVVVCPNADLNGGTEIKLTRGLPESFANRGRPSLREEPWNVELTSGRHCLFFSGASNVVHGKRLNYFCTGGHRNGLWAFPERRSELWTIPIGPFSGASHSRRAIRHAWM